MLTVSYTPGTDLGVGDITVNRADNAACLVDKKDIKKKPRSLPDGRACYGDHEAGKGNTGELAVLNRMITKERLTEKVVEEPTPEDEDRRKHIKQAGVC